jgi:solute carrier family 25 phosphate transporter 3
MAAFVVFENAQSVAYKAIDKSTISNTAQTAIDLGSGLLAGFAAAVVNKTRGLPGEGTISRLSKIIKELGFRGSYSGIGPRLVMVGGMGAGQFAIYGSIKKVCVFSLMCAKFDKLIQNKALGATE